MGVSPEGTPPVCGPHPPGGTDQWGESIGGRVAECHAPAATGRGGGAKEEGEEGEDEEYKANVKRKEQEVESAQRGTVVTSASEIGMTSLHKEHLFNPMLIP